MFEHPILNAIARRGFMPLGWFAPRPEDQVPAPRHGASAQFIILIGNAGPAMFRRFLSEAREGSDPLDGWCRETVEGLAGDLEARAIFPFDEPAPPFLKWAKLSGACHASPLGLNIHADYGLWHAYRAALIFPVAFDLAPIKSHNPCDACAERPCLAACPVKAFDGRSFNVDGCTDHINSPQGSACMTEGCLARRACPVGQAYAYEPRQMQFHMAAFRNSRLAARHESR